MSKEAHRSTSRGSRRWPMLYALTSLRKQWVRNTGIALFLAISIAMPTTVFTWSSTSIEISVENYFAENSYQIQITAPDSNDVELLRQLSDRSESYELVESIDYFVSSPGVLTNSNLPGWFFYNPNVAMANLGVVDTRVIPVTSEVLSRITGEFEWTGNSTMKPGEILVSQTFVDHCERAIDMIITKGSVIGIDVLTGTPGRGEGGTPSAYDTVRVQELTVAGIYDVKSLNTLLGDSFPSILRSPPFTTDEWARESVLGFADSVLILQEEIGFDAIRNMGYASHFYPVSLVRGSVPKLLALGPSNVQTNLEAIGTQIEGEYLTLLVLGSVELNRLGEAIETYVRSQILTLLAVPVILMSMFITVFTAESTIARRRAEISILRARGASFNQIISSIMWESGFLTLIGISFGLAMTLPLVPLMGSSTGLLSFDPETYFLYLANINVPLASLIIAGVIAMYLPGLYLFHIQRNIDVGEIGQPVKDQTPTEVDESDVFLFAAAFGLLVTFLFSMPILFPPVGNIATLEVIIATLLLFALSYLGSRAMQHAIASISSGAGILLGEKRLYVTQSLRRRKGKFIPLLVILTLSLTTSTMMLIESSSFSATYQNELDYAIGADMRIESSSAIQLDFVEELETYNKIEKAIPVIQMFSEMGNQYRVFLECVNALDYLEVANFNDATFVHGNATTVLNRLHANQPGIVVSESHALSLNKSLGDVIGVRIQGEEAVFGATFLIVGLMRSAPGFGSASRDYMSSGSVASKMGFQVVQDGFALVNIRHIQYLMGVDTTDLFLASAIVDEEFSEFCGAIEDRYRVRVYSGSRETEELGGIEIQNFLSGVQGLTMAGSILCVTMAIAAIGLFFGSAIQERKPEYAIFRALGATRKQVASIVAGEFAGLIISAIVVSTFLGVVFGYSMSLLIFSVSPLSLILPHVLTIPVVVVISILLIEWFVMLAAVFYPADSAGRVGMIEELRNL